ncbi:hypothetical protein U1Q18_052655 [Sarracenia purpurea var. burkii]
MAFLSSVRPKYELARSQILTSREIFLTETYSRVNQSIRPQSSQRETNDCTALVSHNPSQGRGRDRRVGRGGRGSDGKVICFHGSGGGHMVDKCWKLHGKPPTTRSVNVVLGIDQSIQAPTSTSSNDGHVALLIEDYARLMATQINLMLPLFSLLHLEHASLLPLRHGL